MLLLATSANSFHPMAVLLNEDEEVRFSGDKCKVLLSKDGLIQIRFTPETGRQHGANCRFPADQSRLEVEVWMTAEVASDHNIPHLFVFTRLSPEVSASLRAILPITSSP